jgi:hypothetical protein
MAYTKTIELPQTVQPRQLRIDVAAEIRHGIESLKVAVARIWEIEDLPRVNSIEDMAADWVQSVTAEGIEATKANKSLTAQERGERLKVWRKIKQDAIASTAVIQNFIEGFPDLVFCLDPESGTVTCSQDNIDKIVAQRSTVPVPDLAHVHWAKLQTIVAAIRSLREWEQQNDVAPFLVGNAVNCSPFEFAAMWATGANAINHRYDHYRVPIAGDFLTI